MNRDHRRISDDDIAERRKHADESRDISSRTLLKSTEEPGDERLERGSKPSPERRAGYANACPNGELASHLCDALAAAPALREHGTE